MKEKKLTILTPTYNRRSCLDELFASLIDQTSQNFQWIIIDDGSKDETREWFDKLPGTNFQKVYLYKENGGKHKALNFSHPYILGDYVMVVDSDDLLPNDAVQTILEYWDKYDKMDDVSGITFLRGKKSGEDYTSFGQKELLSNVIVECNGGLKGEFVETVRKKYFLENPFPEFEGEKYFPESWLWVKIGEHLKTVYVRKVVYIFEYLNDGLTRNGRKLRLQSPRGCACAANLMTSNKFSLSIRCKKELLYIGYLLYAKAPLSEIVFGSNSKALTCVLLPAGFIIKTWWKIRYK